MKKRLFFALILLTLLSTYKVGEINSKNSNYNIKEIFVENNFIINDSTILKKLSILNEKNIYFLKNSEIENKLKEIDLIDSFEVKKVYPDKIKIKIFEKKPIAIIQNKKEKKFFTNKNDVITFSDFKQFKDLPTVFGDKNSFRIFYEDLKKINFPFNEVKTFYLFESKRWDLLTHKNQTIKLPAENYNQSLLNFINIKEKTNFEKYKTFDYRISNQLILK